MWEGGDEFVLNSHRLVSLFDMLKFYPYKFLRTITLLEFFTDIRDNDKYNFSRPECKPAQAHLIKTATELLQTLTKMDLKLSADKASDLLDHIKNIEKVDLVFKQYVTELYSRLDSELKSRIFLVIMPGGREKYYNPDEPIFGIEFPDLVEDISEAGNCFALDRFIACVFHLMRVMEKSVQKLAHKLGIPPSFTYDEEWQTIVNAIRTKLKTLYPKGSNANRIKYESILAHLETIKIAWRNPTMHPKATYTEEEARALLGAVEIFIKDLARVL